MHGGHVRSPREFARRWLPKGYVLSEVWSIVDPRLALPWRSLVAIQCRGRELEPSEVRTCAEDHRHADARICSSDPDWGRHPRSRSMRSELAIKTAGSPGRRAATVTG